MASQPDFSKRDRFSPYLAQLARKLKSSPTPDVIQRVANELERLALG